tara:strand:- start:1122 stop:1298 length:177 start_codon:yes stop_codon:yes gene_type:complete
MPLHLNDCGFIADTIEENVKYNGWDKPEEDKQYWLSLAKRFRESMETGTVILDTPYYD